MLWPLVLKLLYTLVLVGLVVVLSREAYLVWFDDRVFVGRFDIVKDENGQDAEADDFARRIVTAQAVLADQLADYQRPRSAVTDVTFNIDERERVSLPREALKGIDITVQSVNITQILTALRKTFSSPNEVSGHVTSTSGSVLASVNWPRAPKPVKESAKSKSWSLFAAAGAAATGAAASANTKTNTNTNTNTEPLSKFYVPAQPTIGAAARYIACSLSWARAAAKDAKIAKVPRAQFCDFALALGDLYDLAEKASLPSGISDDEAVRVRRRMQVLAGHHDGPGFLPDIYRLRADLIDLLPDKHRTINDLVDAQEDRLSYAMLDPKIAALPAEEKRFTVLALARPAIPIPDGELREVPENWKALLVRHAGHIERAAKSTALVLKTPASSESKSDGAQTRGTAFMVAPNLALTASHVVANYGGGDPLDGHEIHLCFGDDEKHCTDRLKVTKIHYLGEVQHDWQTKVGTDVALLEVAGHSPVFHPPLPLAAPEPGPVAMVGSYAFVIGYAFDAGFGRLPERFVELLLRKQSGVRRMIPGRILAFDVTTGHYTSDISTTAGTSGGPLVDLTTGSVLGLSFAGLWHGERGKFAYALNLPKEVRAMIDQRLRGEPITPPPAPASAVRRKARSRQTVPTVPTVPKENPAASSAPAVPAAPTAPTAATAPSAPAPPAPAPPTASA